ncbi:unnamed protein product [Cunninghamella blakesleeana]
MLTNNNTNCVADFNCAAYFNNQVNTLYISHVLKSFSSIVLFFYECDFKSSAINDIELVRSYYPHFINQQSLPMMISTDTTAVHQAFFSSHIKGALLPTPFPILADVTRLITRYFGVMNDKTGNPNRSVFIIDANQEIKYSYIPFLNPSSTMNTNSMSNSEDPYNIPQILNVITAIRQDN